LLTLQIYAACMAVPVIYAALFYIIRPDLALLIAVLGGCLSFFVWDLWLSYRIQRRRNLMARELPRNLELLIIPIESGLGQTAALSKVIEKNQGLLTVEFARVIRENQMGKTFREAMLDMARRVNLPTVTNFVVFSIMADSFGTSLSKMYRTQLDSLYSQELTQIEMNVSRYTMLVNIALFMLFIPGLVFWLFAVVVSL